MTPAHLAAVESATDFLTGPHHLLQALVALQRGRVLFRPEPFADPLSVRAHLEQVAIDAENVRITCHRAGLSHLAGLCNQIANRIDDALRASHPNIDDASRVLRVVCAATEALADADPLSV